MDTTIHEHHLLQVVLGLEKSFKLFIGEKWIKTHGALIDADVPHQFDSKNGWHAILLMDPEMEAAIKMKIQMGGDVYHELDFSLFGEIVTILMECSKEKCLPQHARDVINDLVKILINCNINSQPKDKRIQELLIYIDELEEKNISVKNLADMTGLSESRLIHLFTEEIGIPIRRYILWRRLLDAVNHIIKGTDFTEAAYAAGFSDSAHLSRTFKRMFGITMFNLFKNFSNSRFVQVITDESQYIR